MASDRNKGFERQQQQMIEDQKNQLEQDKKKVAERQLGLIRRMQGFGGAPQPSVSPLKETIG